MKPGKIHFLTLLGIGALLGSSVVAQPFASSAHRQPADVTGIVAKTETDPPDDAVLFAAPSLLNLHFPSAVRLVKLTLHNEQRDWVDISFRYSPRPQDDYEWELPQLDPAIYYTADWAILVANDRLERGKISVFPLGRMRNALQLLKRKRKLFYCNAMVTQQFNMYLHHARISLLTKILHNMIHHLLSTWTKLDKQ
ncbi:MAG: hypothetical protein Ct9H300mP22_6150 [Gammaproteobacteria bacterium]|nr:MAG: hypothetical protein Ct9H300mP22_6150 [Gammaproteobacteria bacterium]